MITVVGTIQIGDSRSQYFTHSLRSVAPIANLLSWRLNIAGENRESARNLVVARWPDALITTDDNETCTYDLVSAQLALLPDDALVFPWIEDMWFVCPHVSLFLHVLDKFIHSQAEVMPVSHLVTVWEDQGRRIPVIGDRFYSECVIDISTQEQIWKDFPGTHWIISVSSIFKAGLFRAVLEHQKERLSKSCRPRGLELAPEVARGFLANRSFTRLVPHFHVFREIVAFRNYPRRCADWSTTIATITLRDAGDMFGGLPKELSESMKEAQC